MGTGSTQLAADLEQSRRRLDHIWDQTSDGWQDSTQAEFTTRYWSAITAETDVFLMELRELSAVLNRARQMVS